MSKIIDLRSDTTSLPTKALISHFSKARVGDFSYGEDPSYNELISYCKDLYNVEDVIFVTSGMLANRLAIMAQTHPGDEVVTNFGSHINFFDSAAMAKICSIVMNTINTPDGIITPTCVQNAINSKPRYKTFAQIKLVSIENTINSKQGKIFPFQKQKELYQFLKSNNINLHLDGARIFHAAIEEQVPLKEYAKYCDTMSFCTSKALGSPFGSILLGKKDIIEKARRLQVWLGSGYHQIGFQASAALYVLKNHMEFIKKSNIYAKLLGDKIASIPRIMLMNPVETNIVGFDISRLGVTSEEFLDVCKTKGLLLFPWLEGQIRAVTYHNITKKDILKAYQIIQETVYEISKQQ